jgi:P27 family predicted phage terminase small subunit
MTRGRKPQPTAKKQLKGNPGKRALNKREPKPKMSADIKPDRPMVIVAGLDGAAIEAHIKRFGDRYVPLLREMQVFTDADAAAFELMSIHYAIAWQAMAIVEREGLTRTDKFGQIHKHPVLQVVRENSTAFRLYAAEFGMTPSSRTRLQTPTPDDPDDVERKLEQALFGKRTRVVTHE